MSFLLVVYNWELLLMLSWSVWWSIMGSYCICWIDFSGGLYFGVIAYFELVCPVVYNGELLHLLSWSVWGSIMGFTVYVGLVSLVVYIGSYFICWVGMSGGLKWRVIVYVELVSRMVYNVELLHILSWSVWLSIWGVVAYIKLFRLVVNNGELLRMLSWSLWWCVVGVVPNVTSSVWWFIMEIFSVRWVSLSGGL